METRATDVAAQCTLSDFLSFDVEQTTRIKVVSTGSLGAIAQALRRDEPASYPPAKALVDFARVYLRDADPHLFRAYCTIRGERGWRFLFGCSFFRAIDNVADSTVPAARQDWLIERYRELTRQDVDPQSISPADVFETIILAYMALERKGSPRTLDCLHDIIRSLRMDLDRRGQILSWDAYQALNHYRAVRPMEAFFRLLLDRDDEITRQVAWHLGTFAIYIDDIRDLKEDLALGFINVTREELQDLGVDSFEAMSPQHWKTFVARRNAVLLEHSQACLQLLNWSEIAPVRKAVTAAVYAALSQLKAGGFQIGQGERWSLDEIKRFVAN